MGLVTPDAVRSIAFLVCAIVIWCLRICRSLTMPRWRTSSSERCAFTLPPKVVAMVSPASRSSAVSAAISASNVRSSVCSARELGPLQTRAQSQSVAAQAAATHVIDQSERLPVLQHAVHDLVRVLLVVQVVDGVARAGAGLQQVQQLRRQGR